MNGVSAAVEVEKQTQVAQICENFNAQIARLMDINDVVEAALEHFCGDPRGPSESKMAPQAVPSALGTLMSLQSLGEALVRQVDRTAQLRTKLRNIL